MTKRIFALIMAAALVLSISVVAFSADTVNTDYSASVVHDEADLLSAEEEAQLNTKLLAMAGRFNADFIIVTTPNLNNADFSFYGTAVDYADRYFETHANHADGVLYLLTLSDEYGKRTVRISTSGNMKDKLSDSEADEVIDNAVDNNSPDTYGYYQFFDSMLEKSYSEINPHVDFSSALICYAIGLIIALIVVFALKAQLKSVKMANGAREYIRQGSLNVAAARDTYLYRTVSRTAKPKDSDGGGHTSSSGTSHGGGGRSF